MARIELDHATKRFGDIIAVDNATVTIADNEFFCIFGPPSSGKTTFLRLVLGLEKPDAGEIRIDGRRVNETPPAERNLAMVFQNLALFPHMNARDNVIFPLIERRVAPAIIEDRLAKIAATLHMGHILHKRPAQLSGGERQRVAIGRALVRDAAAYLMDDPISALDARLREESRVELKRLQCNIGHTFIYVTHDQEEAMSVADRMAVLENGAIRQVDPPQRLYARPRTRYVASLLGSPPMNFVSGAVDRDANLFRAANCGWSVPLEPGAEIAGAPVEIGFRPEHVSVVAPGTPGALPATVISVEPLGASTVVVVDAAATTVKALLKGQHGMSVGEKIALGVPLHRCVFFGADGQAGFVAGPMTEMGPSDRPPRQGNVGRSNAGAS